jgi:murein DD-endopeptidase MepM/ murein hydrolase activator NlpD
MWPSVFALRRLGPALGIISLLLSACAERPVASAADPTAFVATRVAQVLTESAPTPAAPTPAAPTPAPATAPLVAPTAELEFATVTPIVEPLNVPTAGATVTPRAEAAPSLTPGTPCADQACVSVALHLWLERPVPADALIYVDRTYPYGSTQQNLREPHHGVEFVNPTGTLVLAVAPGTVVAAGDDAETALGPATRFYGNVVVLQLDQTYHGQPVYVLYAHMLSVAVAPGQRVTTGETLGVIGQTGVAIGPHLHLEVRVGENTYWATRNPELWLKPALGAKQTQYGVIAGRIVDTNGNLIYGQSVVIRPVKVKEPTRAKYINTYAHESLNGDDLLQENFAIGDLPAGAYSVAVNTTKFYQQTVTVNPGEVAWVTFIVKPPPPTETPSP